VAIAAGTATPGVLLPEELSVPDPSFAQALGRHQVAFGDSHDPKDTGETSSSIAARPCEKFAEPRSQHPTDLRLAKRCCCALDIGRRPQLEVLRSSISQHRLHRNFARVGHQAENPLRRDSVAEQHEFEPSYMDPAPVASRSID